jgi:lycopene cyclase domain-containing protein
VRHIVYLAILVVCLVGTLPLEFALGTRVYARWRQLLITLLPVVVLFGAWDLWAIHDGAWWYDRRYLLGATLPSGILGRLPLEELLFFLVIPTCSILALEAVRARKPHWIVSE